jgi:hypothetical protein
LEQSYKVLSSAQLHELINEIDRRDVVVRNQTVGPKLQQDPKQVDRVQRRTDQS